MLCVCVGISKGEREVRISTQTHKQTNAHRHERMDNLQDAISDRFTSNWHYVLPYVRKSRIFLENSADHYGRGLLVKNRVGAHWKELQCHMEFSWRFN